MPSPSQSRRSRKKTTPAPHEPNHHLVANRGFWWVCCSINATPRTKEKLGFSLGTKCILTARLRRDVFLEGLHAEGLEVRIRRHSTVALGALRTVSAARAGVPWQKRVEEILARARGAELAAGPSNRPARTAQPECCA